MNNRPVSTGTQNYPIKTDIFGHILIENFGFSDSSLFLIFNEEMMWNNGTNGHEPNKINELNSFWRRSLKTNTV